MDELLISAAAEQDHSEALAWYAERSIRAAEGFEAEFAAALLVVAEHPER